MIYRIHFNTNNRTEIEPLECPTLANAVKVASDHLLKNHHIVIVHIQRITAEHLITMNHADAVSVQDYGTGSVIQNIIY